MWIGRSTKDAARPGRSSPPGDTFLRIKGLERPAVVVTDLSLVPASDRDTRNTRMHIAVTRALSALRIVSFRDALVSDPVLAELTA